MSFSVLKYCVKKQVTSGHTYVVGNEHDKKNYQN